MVLQATRWHARYVVTTRRGVATRSGVGPSAGTRGFVVPMRARSMVVGCSVRPARVRSSPPPDARPGATGARHAGGDHAADTARSMVVQGSSRGGHRPRRARRGAGSSREDGSGRPAVNPPLQHVSSAGSGLGAGPEARQPARGVDVGLDLGPVEEPAAAQWRSPNSTYAASSATSCGCVATPRAPVASSSVSRTSISSAGRGPARGLRSRTSSCRPRGRDEAPARFPPICRPAGGPHT